MVMQRHKEDHRKMQPDHHLSECDDDYRHKTESWGDNQRICHYTNHLHSLLTKLKTEQNRKSEFIILNMLIRSTLSSTQMQIRR